MKFYFSFIIVVYVLACTGILSPIYGQWLRYPIDDSLIDAMGVCVADLDGDDTLDVAATSESEGEVYWYENDNLSWQRHLINGSLGGAIFVNAADIDGDGDQDVVADGFQPAKVVWYENNNLTWTPHVIDDKLGGAEYLVTADIDKDDDSDVVITTYNAGEVLWYENNNLTWNRHTIDADLICAGSVAAGDIDGDDTLDVVVSDNIGDDLIWYRNNNGGLFWTKHTIDADLPHAFHVVITDIDGDDKPDIVATAKDAHAVVWYKNSLPDSNWIKQTIDEDLPDCHHLAVADLDNDGDQDVTATSLLGSVFKWYENNYPDWNEYIIDNTLSGCRIQAIADIDYDGFKDIAVTGNFANKLVWYKNLLGVAYPQSWQHYPRYISQQGGMLNIKATISNRKNHSAIVNAVIHGEQYAVTDTLELYDDGQHGDSLESDNIWGNSKWLSNLTEDIYSIGISLHDLAVDEMYYISPTPSFTTIGPIIVESDTIISSDKEPNWGDTLSFYFNLKNIGLTESAKKVTSKLIIKDSCAAFVGLVPRPSYGDIAPGEIKQGNFKQSISFLDQCSGDHTIPFIFEIYSNNYFFWCDTFEVEVRSDPAAVQIIDETFLTEFTLRQNYPNPFNPRTTITFTLSRPEYTTLKIYNILGAEVATLVSDKLQASVHNYTFDGSKLASGVYYYQITAGEFRDVKKMILLR